MPTLHRPAPAVNAGGPRPRSVLVANLRCPRCSGPVYFTFGVPGAWPACPVCHAVKLVLPRRAGGKGVRP